MEVTITDIIERLRSRSPYLDGSSAERTMDEAATEIERLRAMLREIETADAFTRKACLEKMRQIARRALEPKP